MAAKVASAAVSVTCEDYCATKSAKASNPWPTTLEPLRVSKGDYEQALQQFVSQSTWDWRQVRNGIARFSGENLGTEGSLIVDDTGFP